MASSTEHALLERVFLRIGSAETDEQLENAISKFLPPVLLKLSSQQDGVRKKVMELLFHISKRVKSRPTVQLPVEALLNLYTHPDSFVTNFSIIYIKLGYPRMPIEKQAELVPSILYVLDGKPQSHQDSLLMLLMPVLGDVVVPPDPAKRASFFGFSEKPALSQLLLSFSLDILLLPYGATPTQIKSNSKPPSQQAASASTSSGTSQSNPPTPPSSNAPPGMSEYSFKRVTGENMLSPEDLEKTKLGIVKFLSSGVFPEKDILIHLIVAVADTRFGIAHAADIELKKIVRSLDWSSPSLLAPLYTLFLGTSTPRDRPLLPGSPPTTVQKPSTSSSSPASISSSASNASSKQADPWILPSSSALPPPPNKPELRTAPANTRIRLRLLPYICCARGTGLLFPDCIRIVFDSLYGPNTNARLKTMALQFVLLIILGSNVSQLNTVGSILLSGLLKLIAVEDAKIKALAYGAVGKLGARLPHLVNKDLALLLSLFEALDLETPELKFAVKESLLNMMEAFKDMKNGVERCMLEAYLASLTESAFEPMARVVAVKYTASIFPADYPPSRYILLLATGDSLEAISQDARLALYGSKLGRNYKEMWSSLAKNLRAEDFILESEEGDGECVPNFSAMIKCVIGQAEARVRTKQHSQSSTSSSSHLPFPPAVFSDMLVYIRMCYLHQLRISINRTVAYHPKEIVPSLKGFLEGVFMGADSGSKSSAAKSESLLEKYLNLIQQFLSHRPELGALCCLLDLVGSLPEQFASNLSSDLKWLKGILASTSEDMREIASIIYGMVVAHGFDDANFEETMTFLLRQVSKKNVEAQHGYILAICYCLERRLRVKKSKESPLDLDSGLLVSKATFMKGVKAIVPFLENSQPLLVTAACTAIGELGRCSPLPIPDGDSAQGSSQETQSAATSQSNTLTKLEIVNKLATVLKNPKISSKVKEEAAKAVGYLCVGQRFSHRRQIINNFFDMAKDTKDIEVHTCIGRAIICCVLGPHCTVSHDPWKTRGDKVLPLDTKDDSYKEDLRWVLDELLSKLSKDSHPNSRVAWSVWLLELLGSFSKEEEMQKRFVEVQKALVDLLMEKNHAAYHAAKGLITLYSSSEGEEQKKQLVQQLHRDILSSRSMDNNASGSVSNHMATYRELCALASTLEHPELMYHFLDLINSGSAGSLKSSEKLSSKASLDKEEIKGLIDDIPKLVPRIYRGLFHPNPNLKACMEDIWYHLVKDQKKIVDEYHEKIINDITENLTTGSWGDRFSCCHALSNIIQPDGISNQSTPNDPSTSLSSPAGGSMASHGLVSASLESPSSTTSVNTDSSSMSLSSGITSLPKFLNHSLIEKLLPPLWAKLFLVMDDIHDSTRRAATSTARVLAKVCIRACDQDQGKAAQHALNVIVNILLDGGVCSTVNSVKILSLQMVTNLVTTSGVLIKPHLARLLPALIESMGEIEFAIEAAGLTSNTPINKDGYARDTIRQCFQFIDGPILEELVPRIVELMKTSVGVGTRIGCAHLITQLCSLQNSEIAPYTGKLLAGLVSGLSGRGGAILGIRRAYSSAVAHLVNNAKESSLHKLFAKLKTWYLEKDDEASRAAAAQLIHDVAQRAPEVIRAHSSEVMPLAFIAMHGEKTTEGKAAVELWEEAWAEGTPGTEAGVRTHLVPICELIQFTLDSSSWAMKAQAARAAGTVAAKLGSELGPEHRVLLLKMLIGGLKGRTWTGKESLLNALVPLCTSTSLESFPDELKTDGKLCNELIEAVLLEARKKGSSQSILYRCTALRTLGDLLFTLKVDRFADVFAIADNMLSMDHGPKRSSETDDLGSDDEDALHFDREELTKLREAACESLGKAWPSNLETQVQFRAVVVEKCVVCLKASTRPEQIAIIEAMRQFVDRLILPTYNEEEQDEEAEEDVQRVIQGLGKTLSYVIGIPKYTKLRKEALNVLAILARNLINSGRRSQLIALTEGPLCSVLKEVKQDSQPEVKASLVRFSEVLAEEDSSKKGD
ncbi:proteasome adapter and scaffold protein ECM29-like [Ischnura elegans]|uniref:proteasome adapter and scaffold protein ECM29-like n=1 Tax=Ischnura elegans TaxID=197161 RepID=UPI001ED87CEC|nr:proteasome adapter and scaffold protein ECM29-like [Ischnura elegans]